jgi:ankyrin repeat protein
MMDVLENHKGEANVNVQDGVGNTCLHYSAQWGHTQTLQLMLDAGTDPKIVNFQGDSALHKAFYKDDLAAVRLLVQRGGDMRATNKQGMKPGDYAQSVEGRKLREELLAATKPGLVVPFAPAPPSRASKRREEGDVIDVSKLPGVAAAEEDIDEDAIATIRLKGGK